MLCVFAKVTRSKDLRSLVEALSRQSQWSLPRFAKYSPDSRTFSVGPDTSTRVVPAPIPWSWTDTHQELLEDSPNIWFFEGPWGLYGHLSASTAALYLPISKREFETSRETRDDVEFLAMLFRDALGAPSCVVCEAPPDQGMVDDLHASDDVLSKLRTHGVTIILQL